MSAAICARTVRPAPTRLQGADAMHAWVLVWCGADIGWVGFDPTNDMIASDEHIVLAIGRDYTDVAPMDGVIVVSGGQTDRRRRSPSSPVT